MMKRSLHIAILIIATTSMAFARELPSRPLFAPAASGITAPVLQQPGNSPPLQANVAANAGISSFMYFSPEQWSFWWRGQHVTSHQVPSTLADVTVTPERVRFTADGASHDYAIGKFNDDNP